MKYRLFCKTLVIVAVACTSHGQQNPKKFRVWVFSDAHVGSDLRGTNSGGSDAVFSSPDGRESLSMALRQSEGSRIGFPWDIALDLGDLSGSQGTPKDEEGKEIVRQFSALKAHRREQIYDVSGNHDRSGLQEPQA